MAKSKENEINLPQGFYSSGVSCDIKPSGLKDLALIVADRKCSAAGVFTQSRTLGAPVVVTRRRIKTGKACAIAVNSGNANASTGKHGELDALTMCKLTSELVSKKLSTLTKSKYAISPKDVLVASTGIIGHRLPMDKVEKGIKDASRKLSDSKSGFDDASKAILTTDLVIKQSHRTIQIAGKTAQISAMAKGSGMIAPNMGTMLCFILTDAAVTPTALDSALKEAVADSFNRISIDQHTSPSDMALVLASGAAQNAPIKKDNGKHLQVFKDILKEVCKDLAYQIVADGEGANCVLRVKVRNARNEKDADKVGKAIVDSPLVKTALHGGDANWGRVITAAGYSGAVVDPEKMSLSIGDAKRDPVVVFKQGEAIKLNQNQINSLSSMMKKKEVIFDLDLGCGEASVQWLGCDLSRQYIAINADYTT